MLSGFSEASQYALRVQLALGISVIAIERLVWWKPVLDQLPRVHDLDDYLLSVALLICVMIYSLYVIFAAIWGVFGDGRWSIRFTASFLLFQALLFLLVALVLWRSGLSNFINDGISLWASATGVYLIYWSVLACTMKGLQTFGYRMTYFCHGDQENVDPNDESTLTQHQPTLITLGGKSSIADLFVLTAWSAVFLTLLLKTYRYFYIEIDSQDVGIFGRDFALILMVMCFGAMAVVSFFTLVPTICFSMRFPRQTSKHFVWQLILFCHFSIWLIGLCWWELIDDEGIVFAIVGSGLFLLFQISFALITRRRESPFRLRLIKLNDDLVDVSEMTSPNIPSI